MKSLRPSSAGLEATLRPERKAPGDRPSLAESHREHARVLAAPKTREEEAVVDDGRARLDVSGVEPPQQSTGPQAEGDDAASAVLAPTAGSCAGPPDVDDPSPHGRRRGDAPTEVCRPEPYPVSDARGDDEAVVCPEDDTSLRDGGRHLDQALSGDRVREPERWPEVRRDEARACRRRAEHRPARVRNLLPARRIGLGRRQRVPGEGAADRFTQRHEADGQPGEAAGERADPDEGKGDRAPSCCSHTGNLGPSAQSARGQLVAIWSVPAPMRSSHGAAPSRSKISRASSSDGWSPVSSPYSSSVTASQNGMPYSRNPPAAALKPPASPFMRARKRCACASTNGMRSPGGRSSTLRSSSSARVRSPRPRDASTAHTKPCLTACETAVTPAASEPAATASSRRPSA